MKANELSIKSIKEELAQALIEDVRIIKTFKNREEKKTKDYIGTTIFGYLNDDVVQHRVNSYISFDVVEEKSCEFWKEGEFKVIIYLMSHKDLLGYGITNCVDDVAEYIKEIVKELYPYYTDYSDVPRGVGNNHARRDIKFCLSLKNAIQWQNDMEQSKKNK